MTFPGLNSTVRENVWEKTGDGRLRMLHSRDLGTDVYYIKDGIFLQTGQPFTLRITRCSTS